jgi:hypothetical protein
MVKMHKEMLDAWTEHAWGCFVLFRPQGKQYAKWCTPRDDGIAPTSHGASISTNIMSYKRDNDEVACSTPIDRALDNAILQDNNSILAAKMMMKYNDLEDKENALTHLSEFVLQGRGKQECQFLPGRNFRDPHNDRISCTSSI